MKSPSSTSTLSPYTQYALEHLPEDPHKLEQIKKAAVAQGASPQEIERISAKLQEVTPDRTQ